MDGTFTKFDAAHWSLYSFTDLMQLNFKRSAAYHVLLFTAVFWILVSIYWFFKIVYNVWLHPTSKFPGPKVAAFSDLWFAMVILTGCQYKVLKKCHEKYGDIVRIGPNELSFSSVKSVYDIYGRPANGRKPFPKSDFWDAIGMGFEEAGIATERDVEKHKRKRSLLQPLVSIRQLRKYYPIVQASVEKFLWQLEKQGKSSEGANIVDLFHFATFDITGDLLFGEPFGALDSGTSHKWFELIIDNVDIAAYTEVLRRIPGLNWIVLKVLPKNLREARTYHVRETKQKVLKRMNSPTNPEREDMMTHLISYYEEKIMTLDEVSSHACQLIIGGSETVATNMTYALYLLIKNPDVYDKVKQEIRSFPRREDIDSVTTANLPWLNSVLKESLRLYTSGPNGFPRVSLGETVDGHYIPAGIKVFSHLWTINRSPKFWKDPEEFHPERWIVDNGYDKKEAFIPFGLGSRQCLGTDMAWDEMRRILGNALWLMDIWLVDPDEDWLPKNKAYFIWAKAPLRVHVKRREGV